MKRPGLVHHLERLERWLRGLADAPPSHAVRMAARHAWIHLSAIGVLDGVLLVSVEVPHAPMTNPRDELCVNLSGPPLDPLGVPRWDASRRIRISP